MVEICLESGLAQSVGLFELQGLALEGQAQALGDHFDLRVIAQFVAQNEPDARNLSHIAVRGSK